MLFTNWSTAFHSLVWGVKGLDLLSHVIIIRVIGLLDDYLYLPIYPPCSLYISYNSLSSYIQSTSKVYYFSTWYQSKRNPNP